ncbi:MAG: hypothetical protein ACOZNI_33360 [Myxococcota bacterium]
MPPAPVEPVVRALAGRIVGDAIGEPDATILDQTAAALGRKLDGMPRHLRAGMIALTAIFDRAGSPPFHAAPPEVQRRRIARWKRLGGPTRDFFAFYEKMSLFLYLSIEHGE